MDNAVILDVNGRDGVSQDTPTATSRALVRAASLNIDGADGVDASPPVSGEPAGTLYVELSPSEFRPEGFTITTLGSVPANRIPPISEILPHRDVVLQAIGGNGENGRRGGDGQSGVEGRPGVDATQVQDATPGTDGGNGGVAGMGTNGADGGDGGKLRIYVRSENTHLLLATRCDVRGGKGGEPGEHGVPGNGGKGGKGGQGFTWEEQNGYQYRCTPNCAGRTPAHASNVRALSRRDPRLALVAGMGSQVAAGSSLQTAIVRLAHYRANTVRDTAGLCECSGGDGHCTGCDAIPVYQTRSRQAATDGIDGQRGVAPNRPLFPGRDGQPGMATIYVTSETMPEQVYRSCYRLELVDFDVEDENEDGIHEPGEHIFIRRIRVKNAGGMPSPKRQPILEVNASEDLLPVVGTEGRALIPSIPPGQTIILSGSIKVKILELEAADIGNESLKKTIQVGLKATMPGLNRTLDHFQKSKAIDIQYPLELAPPDVLRTVAQGSHNRIGMIIKNKGNKPFGTSRHSEIKISIPRQIGSLYVSEETWASEIVIQIGDIPAVQTFEILETAKISHGARDHTYAKIRVDFFISSPISAGGASTRDSRLTQSFVLKVQVVATHRYDDDVGVLVVTNEKTPADQFEAIGDFIRNDLGLKMSVWNVSLYGGLVQHETAYLDDTVDEDETPGTILSQYRGRTIVFLGNKFEHFGLQRQNILKLCESQQIARECFLGSSCLLLGISASKDQRDEWLQNSVFPVQHPVAHVPEHVAESLVFDNKLELTRSIAEKLNAEPVSALAYQVKCVPRWYYGGASMTVKRQAKDVQHQLAMKLPQERFLVSPVLPQARGPEAQEGFVAVWHGLPSKGIIFSTESKPLLKQRGSPTKLHPFDAFSIVSALPYTLRTRLLCDFGIDESSEPSDKTEGGETVDSTEIARYSPEVLDAVQFSLEEDVANEIQTYLRSPGFMNNIILGVEHDPFGNFGTHLPCLEIVLKELADSDEVSGRCLEILQVAITATNPQTKRQVARSIAIPFGQRRSQLKSYLVNRIEGLLRDKGYTPEALRLFHSSVSARYSLFNGKKRDVAKVIEERNRKLTKLSTHEYQKGRQTTQKLVPKTMLCTGAEWDERFRKMQQASERLEVNARRAFQRRAQMSTLGGLDGHDLDGRLEMV